MPGRYVAQRRSDYAAARERYERALAVFTTGTTRSHGGMPAPGWPMWTSRPAIWTGRPDGTPAAEGYERAGAVLGLANCVLGQARVALARGDLDAVAEHVQRAEPMYARMRHVRGPALCLQTLGDLSLARGEPEAAREHFTAARDLFERAGDGIGVADCDLGRSYATGDADVARRLAGRALEGFENVGHAHGVARARDRLAAPWLGRGAASDAPTHPCEDGPSQRRVTHPVPDRVRAALLTGPPPRCAYVYDRPHWSVPRRGCRAALPPRTTCCTR